MNAFETEFQVRFGHVDPAGIAYFPRIFDYIHDVFEELWEQHLGQRYYHLLLEQNIGFPLVHSTVDFRKPLRFGDRPKALVTCTRLGRTSLGLRYRFLKDETLCVDAHMVTTCVRLDTMAPMLIPEPFRRAFQEIREPTP